MDEQLKQRVLISFLTFNLVVIFHTLLFNRDWGPESPVVVRSITGFVIGLVAAGIAYGVMHVMHKK